MLTGGISRDETLRKNLEDMVGFLAPVYAFPGEFEMEALAAGAHRVLTGQEKEKVYTGIPVFQGWDR